jgi:structural maintenance of chromosome 4
VEESKDDLHNNTEKEAVLREDVKKMRGQLEDSRSAQQASKSTSNVLKVLMDAKKSGKVIGIHGRLGDLGSIDDKYDVAVTTACGALNNIVVENTAVAQYCCDLLRKSGAGVATFIMLDKQQHLMDKMSLGKGSFPSDRLFDLVKPKDAKFLPAFYFALRDTLVAPNLDNAMKIAYGGKQRFRVVTLDGSVIDTSGTMSGGGNKVSRGGMSSKPADDVVGLSLKELDALEKKLRAMSSRARAPRCSSLRGPSSKVRPSASACKVRSASWKWSWTRSPRRRPRRARTSRCSKPRPRPTCPTTRNARPS